jgi:hypothetical protein
MKDYQYMKSKYLILIFVGLITSINGFGQISQIPKDTIITRFLKGDMIIINNWALLGPNDFFDSVMIFDNSFESKVLARDTAITKYGYFGDKIRIYELSIPSIDSISYGYFIDPQILKYLNPEKEIFYSINGAPCWSFSNAISLLINKKILKIQEIGPKSASAIWGEKTGKNGALLINTNDKPKVLIMYK